MTAAVANTRRRLQKRRRPSGVVAVTTQTLVAGSIRLRRGPLTVTDHTPEPVSTTGRRPPYWTPSEPSRPGNFHSHCRQPRTATPVTRRRSIAVPSVDLSTSRVGRHTSAHCTAQGRHRVTFEAKIWVKVNLKVSHL